MAAVCLPRLRELSWLPAAILVSYPLTRERLNNGSQLIPKRNISFSCDDNLRKIIVLL
jgi:hypothetical protein